ncbi:MAG: carbamoyltransferase [Paraglaciecola sp.]|jgi:carbamoyltransferase
MSIILGVNSGKTSFGKLIKDGASCLIKDGNIIGAIPEERLSRKKHDGGFKLGVEFLLDKANIDESDIDLVIQSSCCEPEKFLNPTGLLARNEKTVNHHLSHAYNVFKLSGFPEAIVIVIDAGGNVLENNVTNTWWKQKREQHSYYLANESGIDLIERDCDGPLDTGIGELMRAFTYFLGWPSGTLAGNTMAAGKVIQDKCFKGKDIFSFKNGKILSPMENKPYSPVEAISYLTSRVLGGAFEPNEFYQPLSKQHFQLANWVQWNIEKIICEKVNFLVNKTGVDNICFSGGVAYNCPTVTAIRRMKNVNDVYVSWTSGDHGQAIGNALYGAELCGDTKVNSISPYTGGQYRSSKNSLESYIKKKKYDLVVSEPASLVDDIVESLLSEKILALFHGKSESGPRSLGHRSIIARASQIEVVKKLNKIKSRMDFMPIAPVVLLEHMEKLFDLSIHTPYMTETRLPKEPEVAKRYPAAFHTDRSARVQTVSLNDNSLFRNILQNLEINNGEQMILNTSFNLGGEPIVETPFDALDTVIKMDIDTLYINKLKITKRRPQESTKAT